MNTDFDASLFFNVTPDPVGVILETGYQRFDSATGISGLAKANGTRLDVLAVSTHSQGNGQFREFIKRCKERYRTICVWFDENPIVHGALERYGFTPETEIQPDGESVTGMRWDSKP